MKSSIYQLCSIYCTKNYAPFRKNHTGPTRIWCVYLKETKIRILGKGTTQPHTSTEFPYKRGDLHLLVMIPTQSYVGTWNPLLFNWNFKVIIIDDMKFILNSSDYLYICLNWDRGFRLKQNSIPCLFQGAHGVSVTTSPQKRQMHKRPSSTNKAQATNHVRSWRTTVWHEKCKCTW